MIRFILVHGFIIFIYVVALICLTPYIDMIFTPIHNYQPDIYDSNKYIKIMSECILQIIILCISWYYIHKAIVNILSFLHAPIEEPMSLSISVISGTCIVGLQKHLIEKLNYLRIQHNIFWNVFKV